MSNRSNNRPGVRSKAALVALLATLAAGCTTAGSATPAVAPQPRAEPALEAYVAAEDSVVIVAEISQLRALPAFQRIVREVLQAASGAENPLGRLEQSCGSQWWSALEQVVVSGDLERQELLMVAQSRAPETVLRCVAGLVDGAKPARPFGLEGLELGEHEVAVVRGARVFVGPSERVRQALDGPRSERDPSHVLGRLGGSQASAVRAFLRTSADTPFESLGLTLEGDEAHVRLALGLQSRTSGEADAMADTVTALVRKGLADLPPKAATAEMRALGAALRALEVHRHVDRTVGVDLLLEGASQGQAETLLAFAGFARGVVQGFTHNQLVLQAQARVIEIARRVAAYAEAHRSGAGSLPTLPDAAPATPAAVPRGVAQQVTVGDWSHRTWRALEFAPEDELYHAYEITLSRDRRTATVRATGDLYGDGTPSVLELGVHVRFDGHVVLDPEVAVRNAFD